MRKPLFQPIDWADKNFRRNIRFFWAEFWHAMGADVIITGISRKYIDFLYFGAEMFYIFPWARARKESKRFYSIIDWVAFNTFDEYHAEIAAINKDLWECNKRWESQFVDM